MTVGQVSTIYPTGSPGGVLLLGRQESVMLKGQIFLSKVNEMKVQNVAMSEIASACGYKDLNAFYEELLNVKGYKVEYNETTDEWSVV